MATPLIHPNWDKAPNGITDGFSLEMTAKDIESLRETALVRSWGGHAIALPFVAGYSTTQLVERLRGS